MHTLQGVALDDKAQFTETCVMRIGEAVAAEMNDRSQDWLADVVGRNRSWASRLLSGKGPLPTLHQVHLIETALELPRGHLLRAAGLVGEPTSVRDAIRSDPLLDVGQRRAVLRGYDFLTGGGDRRVASSVKRAPAKPKTKRS